MKRNKTLSTLACVLVVVLLIGVVASLSSKLENPISSAIDNVLHGSNKDECEHVLVDVAGQNATCTNEGWEAYQVCLNCTYSTKEVTEPLNHKVTSHVNADGTAMYVCANCFEKISLTEAYILDGTDYNGMTANDNNSLTFKTFEDTDYPMINDGYYDFTSWSTYGTSAQAQIWIPSEGRGFNSFSAENDAVGVISFKINTNLDEYLEMYLVEGYTDNRWGEDWCIKNPIFSIFPHGTPKDYAYYDIKGVSGAPIKTILRPTETSTGWIDVIIAVELDEELDSMNLHYYIGGDYIGTERTPLTTNNNSITCLYINCRTKTPGTGYQFDDLVFGYTTVDTWKFLD